MLSKNPYSENGSFLLESSVERDEIETNGNEKLEKDVSLYGFFRR